MKNFHDANELEVGIDEAGLGTLVGSAFSAAVILPPNCPDNSVDLWNLINDSKKVKRDVRSKLAEYIKKIAVDYCIEEVTKDEIEKNNILNARLESYHRLLNNLILTPSLILIDGNRMRKYKDIRHLCIIKGDGKYRSIAAASILAKDAKDKEIAKLSQLYPEYKWETNSGYLTSHHNSVIVKRGITEFHRKTFGICKNYLKK